ncbi:MAG: UvrD-helicase domain-containing protein [Oscillospiraceae bacterium]|jgi:DNA helicase-2/ATP-dependent DNA helicase PcrA|nr:UvrD-helicase domain-containing protein [Oscillospiraceae bacterium]
MVSILSETALQLRRQVLEKEFSHMNERQREAVFLVNGPLLVLAGAGSGKTTVLVNRIANIIRNGNAYADTDAHLNEQDVQAMQAYLEKEAPLPDKVQEHLAADSCAPWQILAITFTNKAAGELKQRLADMLGEAGSQVWASTFHSTCARMLRQYGDKLGYTNHFTIYDSDDSRRLMKSCLKELDVDEKVLACKSVISEISHAKDSLIEPQAYMEAAGGDNRLVTIAKAYQMYQQQLKEADAMDFDDLISCTVRLLQENSDVLTYYQRKFRYIMVDEYQDTNHAQYVLIKLLAQKSGNLCVVGDDDQSIYKFRGATIENILGFEKTFPNAKTIRLEQNYRSTQTILNAANAVIANNTERKGKTLWTENPVGNKIQTHTALNEQDEATYIGKQILDGVSKGRKFSDYAILYRMNTQSSALEKNFVKSGIPYRIIGGLRFYEHKEVRDMIAYLSVVNNSSDEIRLRRIINQPKRSIGDKTLSVAFEIASQIGENVFYVISHADEFEPLKRTAPKLLQFAEIMKNFIEINEDKNRSLKELYDEILSQTGYIESLGNPGNDEVKDRIDNLTQLGSNIQQYEEENDGNVTLDGFLEEVALMTDIDNYDSEADTVVMMTMHSAKGLEFPVVFLPGFEDGIFPGVQAIYNPEQIEEERRLAYVAITRAREELFILNAQSRMIFGSTNRNKPSRFLNEIPEELTEHTATRSWKHPKPGVELPVSSKESRASSMESALHFGVPEFAHAQKAPTFKPGDAVLHRAFGKGMVLSATPMGNDTLLEIAFDEKGTKKIMANFAHLKRA